MMGSKCQLARTKAGQDAYHTLLDCMVESYKVHGETAWYRIWAVQGGIK